MEWNIRIKADTIDIYNAPNTFFAILVDKTRGRERAKRGRDRKVCVRGGGGRGGTDTLRQGP
jgi:hypothetical protein